VTGLAKNTKKRALLSQIAKNAKKKRSSRLNQFPSAYTAPYLHISIFHN